MATEVLVLDGAWMFKEFPETARRMRDLDAGGWLPAVVPGSVYTCLAEAGRIDPAELTARPDTFKWVSEKSWIFRTAFDADEALLKKQRQTLIFEGLDTVCQVWLNDKLLGKTDNMFIPHTFDITGRLKAAHNVLTVKFIPALQEAEQRLQRYGKLSEHHFGDARRSYIRKAQYQFGSVIGPALVGGGIFRGVRIEGFSIARIDHLHIRTVDCRPQNADIRIAVALQRVQSAAESLRCRLRVSGHGQEIEQDIVFAPRQDRQAILMRIQRPRLWQPAGYGQPHLYHLRAELDRGDGRLDTVETDFGIRTVRIDRTADEPGSRFRFVVNEQPVYIRGANWMPLSMQPGRAGANEYAVRLQQAAEAHINMLRVWAGGYYENDDFYRLCDRLGILVWQDFMFAAAYYPDRQWFTAMVCREARTVIERLRNHPCLALWCGNSRVDALHQAGRLGTGRKFYGRAIYHDLLPSLLSELDPDREYIPTTPCCETATDPDASISGTTHSWNVWNHYADLADYEPPESRIPRFVTEFGLQALPALQTLALFEANRHEAIGPAAIDRHNYQPGGPQRLARYAADNFIPSGDLQTAVLHSQLTQARAVRRHVEYLRAHNTINSGCLIWTFNEPAPAVGFSMVDAQGLPKALYYYARRFFAPVLVTLTPDGATAAPVLTVINDSPRPLTAALDCRVLDFSGRLLDRTQIPVALAPYSRSRRYPLAGSLRRWLDDKSTLIHLRLENGDGPPVENVYFPAPDKYRQRVRRELQMEIVPAAADSWRVTLTAATVLRDVQIRPPRPAVLSDNFITLLPQQPQTVTVQYDGPAPPPRTPLELMWV